MDLLEAIINATRRGWEVKFDVHSENLHISASKIGRNAQKYMSDCHLRMVELSDYPRPGQLIGGKIIEITDDLRAR